MSELSPEEREALGKLNAWEHGCSDEETEAFHVGAREGFKVGREYNKQREIKLKEALRANVAARHIRADNALSSAQAAELEEAADRLAEAALAEGLMSKGLVSEKGDTDG